MGTGRPLPHHREGTSPARGAGSPRVCPAADPRQSDTDPQPSLPRLAGGRDTLPSWARHGWGQHPALPTSVAADTRCPPRPSLPHRHEQQPGTAITPGPCPHTAAPAVTPGPCCHPPASAITPSLCHHPQPLLPPLAPAITPGLYCHPPASAITLQHLPSPLAPGSLAPTARRTPVPRHRSDLVLGTLLPDHFGRQLEPRLLLRARVDLAELAPGERPQRRQLPRLLGTPRPLRGAAPRSPPHPPCARHQPSEAGEVPWSQDRSSGQRQGKAGRPAPSPDPSSPSQDVLGAEAELGADAGGAQGDDAVREGRRRRRDIVCPESGAGFSRGAARAGDPAAGHPGVPQAGTCPGAG